MKFKILIVYSLLLSFFVLLTPRFVWHECDDHHEVHSKNEVHLEQTDCFACDFDLGIISVPFQHFFVFEKQKFAKFDLTSSSIFNGKEFDSFLLRGPPVSN